MIKYKEEDFLQLSGIQHFAFCPRQWALIHIEQKWAENFLTTSGKIFHNKVHSDDGIEKRGNLIIARGLKVYSAMLGIAGECDVVEFHLAKKGIAIRGCTGYYRPYPIEYKRGSSKVNACDRLQLCAQAMCLEEMLSCKIIKGSLFYGKTRRREIIEFSPDLRYEVERTLEAMHNLYARQCTPIVERKAICHSCSIKDDCASKIAQQKKTLKKYLEDGLV